MPPVESNVHFRRLIVFFSSVFCVKAYFLGQGGYWTQSEIERFLTLRPAIITGSPSVKIEDDTR